MSKFFKRSVPVPAMCLAVALSACGGGGGGGGSTASAPVAVTAANASQVASTSYEASSALQGAGSGGVGALTGAVVQTSATRVDLMGAIVSQIGNIEPLLSAAPVPAVTGAQVSASVSCTNGGTVSLSLNDVNNDQQLSTGETASISFSACDEGGILLNGSLGLTNVTVTGDIATPLAAYSLQVTVTASGFTAVENGQTAGLNGGFVLSQSTSDGVSFSSSISGTSMQVTEAGVTVTLTNFQSDGTSNDSTGAFRLSTNATVSSSVLGGSVTIVTDTPFQGTAPDYPSSGQATITGANGTTVTLIALDSVNVRLQINSDGVPGVDQTIDTTWAALP